MAERLTDWLIGRTHWDLTRTADYLLPMADDCGVFMARTADYLSRNGLLDFSQVSLTQTRTLTLTLTLTILTCMSNPNPNPGPDPNRSQVHV